MVLKHVPQDPCLFIIPRTMSHAQGLSRCYGYMINVSPVPYGFKYGVGKAEHEDILNGLLGQIMIHPEYLAFLKMIMKRTVQVNGCPKVSAKGLLHNDPRPAIAIFILDGKTGPANHVSDILVKGRRHSKIKNPVSTGSIFFVLFLEISGKG